MSIMFITILEAAKLHLAEVRLLRHKDKRAEKGRTPYELWRDNLPQFDLYQSTQRIENRSKLNAPFWAVFVGTPADETLFVGLYRVKYQGLLKKDTPMPHRDAVDKAGSCDVFTALPGFRWGEVTGRDRRSGSRWRLRSCRSCGNRAPCT